MGCDIHLYREQLVNGRWVSADKWEQYDGEDYSEVPFVKRFTGRNYDLFAVLAGVRERETPPFKFEPRGLPLQLSPEVKAAAERWDGDGHSHSHLYLHELLELQALLKDATQTISGMKDRDELKALRDSIASGKPDWGLLYPYCQGTNNPKHERFEISVPASFAVGASLDKIVDSLLVLDNSRSRIVFWFDN